MPDPKVLSQSAAKGAAAAPLPPAGHARDEVLRERSDVLAEAAEAQGHTHERFDPSAIEVQNEIASRIVDERGRKREITNAQPGYRYKLIRAFNAAGGADYTQVEILQMIFVKEDGAKRPCWEIVCGTMPEAPEWKNETGLRRVGDAILLRCKEEYALELDRREVMEHIQRRGAVTARLEELGERYRKYGVHVTVDNTERSMSSNAIYMPTHRATANLIARDSVLRGAVDRALREGNMPGLGRAPGR